ncbi:hypothetical protein DL766_007208 [Monosporascus sp. MC13-8B]|uniref:Uncharacterized protein n=1 Tax=Monosporascus cannonballus TaxID=155416 RepID=A0ABY0GZ67_9PEZI|nr:hypothetical protein DL762_008941 [Monosporascus cannonballus]RYO89691.1 hypothetical protein DL763_005572 [Monosporascus cannonballus]RYP24870.1 hypothetical protein DL766_007208 [Monosporascus sp. MC13-8B]
MHKSIIIAVSALAASAAALPRTNTADLKFRQQEPLGYWPATDFREACTPGGCMSSFELTAPEGYYGNAPGFNVHCHSVSIPQPWTDCDPVGEQKVGSTVQAMWTEVSEREHKIFVSHTWTEEPTAAYNASGAIEVGPGASSFEVPILSITGIA